MKKTYSKDNKMCRVTFELPAEAGVKSAALCGEFNNWDKSKHQLVQRKKGNHSLTISLEANKEYRFRYWVDGKRWENDWNADRYVGNEFGTEDSVVVI